MRILKRRRRENKTDYHKRIGLLKSETPRIVFRKSNRYIIAQYVLSDEAKDKIIIGVDSRALLKHGWPEEMSGSLKSIPASYLTGFYLGKKINEKKLENPILDMGMIRSINKNKVFAFIKGIVDSGIEIKCDPEHFPTEDRIKGKNLKKDFSATFSKIKTNIDKGESTAKVKSKENKK